MYHSDIYHLNIYNKSKNMKVENLKVVTLSMELYIQGEREGTEEMIHQARETRPMVYCQGEGMMISGFEARMAGKEAGEEFDFVVPCAEAYGEHDERGVKELPRKMFYNGNEEFDEEHVYVGAIIPMLTDDGMQVNAEVVNIGEKTVTIDLNHPLAGEDLHFKGKVLEVRQATEEELEQIRNPHHCCGKKGGCKKGNCKKNGCEPSAACCQNAEC